MMKLKCGVRARCCYSLLADGRSLHEAAGRECTHPAVPAPGTVRMRKLRSPPAGAEAADDRTSLIEPKGPIDPKSVEAAGQVVQHYGALIEQSRWTKSSALWGRCRAPRRRSSADLAGYADVHLEIGDLGDAEGAAGSIYVTDAGDLLRRTKNGGSPYRRPAEVTLRRVNDVPGSTDAQRRWHIERIDWKSEKISWREFSARAAFWSSAAVLLLPSPAAAEAATS